VKGQGQKKGVLYISGEQGRRKGWPFGRLKMSRLEKQNVKENHKILKMGGKPSNRKSSRAQG
jgi:hypothetical protein